MKYFSNHVIKKGYLSIDVSFLEKKKKWIAFSAVSFMEGSITFSGNTWVKQSTAAEMTYPMLSYNLYSLAVNWDLLLTC